MGKVRQASEIQMVASKLTKMNTGKKRVPIAQVREILRDLIDLEAEAVRAGMNGPLECLQGIAYALSERKS